MFISVVVHQGPSVRRESSTSLTKIKPSSILQIMFIFNQIACSITIVQLFLLLVSEKCIYSFITKNMLLLQKKNQQVNTIALFPSSSALATDRYWTTLIDKLGLSVADHCFTLRIMIYINGFITRNVSV